MDLTRYIRDVPDFPEKGILFKDITPILKDPAAFSFVIHSFMDKFADLTVDKVVGIEARGFVIGAPLALLLNVGFVPIRKSGKLPAPTYGTAYSLEYGSGAHMEMHQDAIGPDDSILIIDDVLATGGTVEASIDLIKQSGASVAGIGVLIEIGELRGREKIRDLRIESLIRV